MKYIRLVIASVAVTVLLAVFGVSQWAAAREAANKVHTVATCAATTTEALDANGERISALFVNDSTQTTWIKIGASAVANQGIRLNANGGSYFISDPTGVLDRAAVNCITTSGNGGIILVTEWF